LTGSYAAVPANGPAANESQPHPLPGLRCSGGEQGPQDQKPSPVSGAQGRTLPGQRPVSRGVYFLEQLAFE